MNSLQTDIWYTIHRGSRYLASSSLRAYSAEFQAIIDSLPPHKNEQALTWKEKYMRLAMKWNIQSPTNNIPTGTTGWWSVYRVYGHSPARENDILNQKFIEWLFGIWFGIEPSREKSKEVAQKVNEIIEDTGWDKLNEKPQNPEEVQKSAIFQRFLISWKDEVNNITRWMEPTENEITIDIKKWTVSINSAYRKRLSLLYPNWAPEELWDMFTRFVFLRK